MDFISYDPTDNSLVVQGTEEAIQELQTRIGLFDNAPRQVLIKVEFITTTESIERTFGTEFLYQRGTVNAGTRPGSFVRAGDPVFLNYASGNVSARLRTSLVEGRGKIVSAPIIRTLNNQPAQITASVTQYIFINQVAATGSVIINVPQPVALTATTGLSVAPRINDDNTITLYLAPQIAAFVGTSISPDGTQIPNSTFQGISVVARVRNGETMVLGGLVSKNDDNSSNRVPVLSELPIIGQFFRTNTRRKTTSELLIFVTPTIVDEDTTGNPGGP
ncbi:type II and III secretion system protein [bacterium]|nr:MAG: type II and III secretion system protein [bacterium]